MTMYRKKPVNLNAYYWEGDANPSDLPEWLKVDIDRDTVLVTVKGSLVSLTIREGKGYQILKAPCWVLKNEDGMHYLYQNTAFKKFYEEAP